jgi:hypothetical protein
MTNREGFYALVAAILLITAGFVWLYGPFGLIGGGVAVAVLTLFTDTNDETEDDDG